MGFTTKDKHPDIKSIIVLAGIICTFCFNSAKGCTLPVPGNASYCRNSTLPPSCTVHNTTVLCSSNHTVLNYIPRFPDNITEAVFIGNSLIVINEITIQNLTCIRLTSLTFNKNNIKTLSQGAFNNLCFLKEIKIQSEHLSGIDVSNSLFYLQSCIERVILTNLSWNESNVPRHLFKGLENKNVIFISLEQNSFEHLNGQMFANLTNLRELNMNKNYLQHYNFTGLEQIEKMDLSNNWFIRLPDFCQFNLSNLRHLNMEYSKIVTLNPSLLRCLDNLKYLNLNGLPISVIHNNTFSNLSSLSELHMSRTGCQLRRIEPSAFTSATLQYLDLSHNDFTFSERSVNVDTIFRYTKYLSMLDVSYNKINMDGETFGKMLKPLTRMEDLKMKYLGLSYLPAGLFNTMKNLTKLNLRANFFSTWNGHDIFGNMTSLINLDLSNNRISILNETSIPLNVRKGLKYLNLMNNIFSCDCEAKWFWKWLREVVNASDTHIKVAHAKRYKCVYPKPLYGKHILHLTYKEICPISESLKIILIAASFAVLFVCLILTIVYILRWHIRYCIYTLRMRGSGYERIPDSSFENEIYIVYADEDREFVLANLKPKLEDEYGISLCIRDRDFGLGSIFLNEMVEKMRKCKKIVLILSNQFAKCKLCAFQLSVAQHRLVMEKNNMFVIILLEDIHHRHLTTSLLILLTSPYIPWPDGQADEDMFWTQVLRSVREHYRSPQLFSPLNTL